MTNQTLSDEPGRINEPQAAEGYSEVLTQVAAERRAVIVCRNGEDLAAVIPMEHLELVREILGRRDIERLAAQIDWEQARKTLQPPQDWFDGDEPKPF